MNDTNKTHRRTTKRTLSFLGKSFETTSPSSRKSTTARVIGPYYDANVGTYRLVVIDGATRKSIRSQTEEAALRLKAQIEQVFQQNERTIREVVGEFIEDKRNRGLKERSLKTMEYKLRYFLPLDDVLGSFTSEQAQQLYESETVKLSRYKRPMRVQTHQSLLKLSKHFFRWAVERKYVAVSPFEKVKPIGKPHAGKEQLRIDEGRRMTQVLVSAAERAEVGAIAVLCQLLLGLRSGEVIVREVRDLDDDGWVLWIPSGKTHNARRRLEVPEILRPFLLRLVAGQPPERLIFGGHRQHPYKHMWMWRQVKKYCLQANLPRVCPHSLRGLHSSLAVAAGCTSSAVAAALGHGSFAITAKHYVDPDTLKNSAVRRVSDALTATAMSPEDDITRLLERLRTLSPEVRSALLRTLAAETAN